MKADPGVKRGGTLRFGVNSAPAHFDVHQSRLAQPDAGPEPVTFFGIYDVVRWDTVSVAS